LPSATVEPRCRQTLRNARNSSSRARVTRIGVRPAIAVKNEPGSAAWPVCPTYCHVRVKIRSCSRRRTFGSVYQLQGSVLCTAGKVSVRSMAVTKTKKQIPFEQFMAFRRFSAGLAFSPDGAHVYFVNNMSGQFNLWRTAGDDGWPEQLSAFTDDTVRLLGVSPRDGSVVFCADHDGDEFFQIYLLDPETGWPEKLTDAPEVQHYVGGDAVSPDGTMLAYAAHARQPTDVEVWIRDLDSGETRSVFGQGKYSFPAGWSPDGSKLVALDFRHNSDSTLHLVDLETGEAPEVTPH